MSGRLRDGQVILTNLSEHLINWFNNRFALVGHTHSYSAANHNHDSAYLPITAGEWTSVPFDSGNFTGGGTMTWTVEEADQAGFSYTIIRNTMIVAFAIKTTTVGGSVSDRLLIKIPASKTAAFTVGGTYFLFPGSVGWEVGLIGVDAGSDKISLYRYGAGSNFATSTNGVTVQGQVVIPI